MTDSEQDKIFTCSKNIEKTNMEISQLQHIKYRLMCKRRQLLDETSRSERKTTIDDMDRETKNIYDKVLPLVSEIHNLELRSLELKEQIQLAKMEQEANALMSTLAKKNYKKSGRLSEWFKELEQMNIAGSTVNNPRYQTWTHRSGTEKEKLEFTVFHCGVSVNVEILITRLIQELEDSAPGDSSLKSVDVNSDIFIPDLLETVRRSLQEKIPLSVVVQTVAQYIADEIAPYTDSNSISKTSEEEKKLTQS